MMLGGCAMTRLIALLSLFLLTACQAVLEADVTSFHGAALPVSGQSFTILPEGPQAGSLEFQSNAQLVANALVGRGFHAIPPDAQGAASADLVVLMHYGTSGAKTEIFADIGPTFGAWGGWGGPRWGGGFGGWGPPYYQDEATSYTTFYHVLELEIFDGQAWRANKRVGLFQGRAVGQTANREVNPAMPYLVQALFANFPGVSGQTVKVKVPLN
jgi:hypothetical protein